MKKTSTALLLLTLAACARAEAQTTIFLENFESGTSAGGYISTNRGNTGTFGNQAGAGTGGSAAGYVSFDNGNGASFYSGSIGVYEDSKTQGTSSSASDYTISFDVRATNLAPNTTATFTPMLTLIRSYNYQDSYNVSGPTLTFTGAYVHYSFNVADLTPGSNNAAGTSFGQFITDPNYDQTSFSLALNDLGSNAFNAGSSSIFIDNLEISQISQVPESGAGLRCGEGLLMLVAGYAVARRFGLVRTA